MKDILVITGGAGFCGSHLAQHFLSKFQIKLFDAFERDSLRFFPELACSESVEIIKGNILDAAALRAAITGARAVIHCAAIAGVSNYYKRPIDVLRVNILGTFNLLDALVEAGVPQVIHFSTSEIYGPNAKAVAETAPAISGPVSERRWVYAVSKLSGEHATIRFGEFHQIAATVVRPFNIYGPGQTGEGAINNFARQLVRGVPLEVDGDGSDVRAWCHIKDLVRAIDLMLGNEAARGRTFNIGNPDARLTTLELAETMISIHGQGTIKRVPHRHAPVRLRWPRIDFARSVLGFEPKVGIREGLEDTLAWFMKEKP
jgi:nucleoside-diphosphate-sugar epimerase